MSAGVEPMSRTRIRLDQLVVERGLAVSRQAAQGLIRAGGVLVDERPVDKPGRPVPADAAVRLKTPPQPYVSRGGQKLEGALSAFGLTDLTGWRALDVGASTGGFTDCLLQHGAAHVWAVDTGRGQFHERLRRDLRVTVRERANARYLTPAWVDGQVMDLVVIDVSFISLRLILPPLAAVLAPGGSILPLVKPQFEVGPANVGRGGVVRDPGLHRQVLAEVVDFARRGGWRVAGVCASPLAGPAGNREFFLRLVGAAGEASSLSEAQLNIAIEQATAGPI